MSNAAYSLQVISASPGDGVQINMPNASYHVLDVFIWFMTNDVPITIPDITFKVTEVSGPGRVVKGVVV